MTRYYVRGYVNNPRWDAPATGEHKPCGYWYENDTLYGTEKKSKIIQGTAWEVVARTVRHTQGAPPRLVEYAGELYGTIQGALWKWNGVDNWVEVVPSIGEMIYSAIVYNGYIYAGFQDSTLRRWGLGDVGWSLVSTASPATGTYRAAELFVHNGTLYLLSGYQGCVMDTNFNILASFNYDVYLYGISYNSYPWLIVYGSTAGRNGVWRFTGSAVVKEFDAPAGWELMQGGYDICYGRLYTLFRNNNAVPIGEPTYRLWYHTQSGGSLNSVEVGYSTLNIPYSSSGIHFGGRIPLLVYKDMLYFMDNEGSLWLLEESDTGVKVAEGIRDIDWGYCNLPRKSHSVYNGELFVLSTPGILLKFVATEEFTTTTTGNLGFDSPDDSVWPLPNFP